MIIDTLMETIEAKSFACVGLDPRMDWIPQKGSIQESIFDFNKEIIDATHNHVACFKPQIAFYEAYGLQGLAAYRQTIQYARDMGCLVIGDVKRGDIASTADAYAKAHFTGDFEVDFITVNPYMGYDTLAAYLPYLENDNKGIFVLVRTSNPGAQDIEYQRIGDQALYRKVADDLYKLAQNYLGKSGASSLGFVLGGTQSEDISELRQAYSNIPFLIPGYGAQGAQAQNIREYLGQQGHSLVNSSRGIIYAYRNFEDGQSKIGHYARLALESMIQDIHKS